MRIGAGSVVPPRQPLRSTPDAATERMRRLVTRRYQVVRHRTRIKNEVHAILYAHLIPKCPVSPQNTDIAVGCQVSGSNV